MSNITICDICGEQIQHSFFTRNYEIKVNFYDRTFKNPFQQNKWHICNGCMEDLKSQMVRKDRRLI